MVVFDLETTSLNPHDAKIVSCAIVSMDDPTVTSGALNAAMRSVLQDVAITKAGHNVRYDLEVAETNGIAVNGKLVCTMLMAMMVDENAPKNLKYLSEKYIGTHALKHKRALDTHLAELSKKYTREKFGMGNLGDSRVDPQIIKNYNEEDVVNTKVLFQILRSQLTPAEWDYLEAEAFPLERVLAKMELRGVKVDETRLAAIDQKVGDLQTTTLLKLAVFLEPELKAAGLTDINWRSPKQLNKIFYGQMRLDRFVTKRTDTGAPTMQKKHIAPCVIPDVRLKQALDLYFKWRQIATLKSTFVDGIKERLRGGRIYPKFYQTSKPNDWKGDDEDAGTSTGRLSSQDPNFQNLPEHEENYWLGPCIKDCVVPDSSNYLFAHHDYSQIELRVAAHVTKDPVLIRSYIEGIDLHQETADSILQRVGVKATRNMGKTINFSAYYGAWEMRLCGILELDPNPANLAKCRELRDFLLTVRFPMLASWIEETTRYLELHGYVITMYGRRRHLPDINSFDKYLRQKAIRQACNAMVQGPAASIVKRKMIELHEAGFSIANQIHDDIVTIHHKGHAMEEIKAVRAILTKVDLDVPLEVKTVVSDSFLKDTSSRPPELGGPYQGEAYYV